MIAFESRQRERDDDPVYHVVKKRGGSAAVVADNRTGSDPGEAGGATLPGYANGCLQQHTFDESFS